MKEFERLIKQRKLQEIEEQMNRPRFELHPAFSEDEYIFVSTIWKIYKSNPGTDGKKMAVAELREYQQPPQTKWVSVQNQLPDYNDPVLVWVKYKDNSYFQWTDSEMMDPKERTKLDYIEPNSKHCWSLGSAQGYEITHWARVTPAFE